MIEINWANWDSGLIFHLKSRVALKNPYHYGEKRHEPGASLEAIDFLVDTSKYIKNSRLAMFRISKYSSVKGISYLSVEFAPVAQYHCHHINRVNSEQNRTHARSFKDTVTAILGHHHGG